MENNQTTDLSKQDDSGPKRLSVPFKDIGAAKDAGAFWNQSEGAWFAPANADFKNFARWEHVPEQFQAPTSYRLSVPFDERESAKEQGAKWSKDQGHWYAPKGADTRKFLAWEVAHVEFDSPEESFRAKLASVGLAERNPIMDGKFHRCGTLENPQGKDGSYFASLDGIPAGYAKNFKTGEEQRWRFESSLGKSGVTFGPEELQKRILERQQQVKIEREEATREARIAAKQIWDWCAESVPEGTRTYLDRKRVDAFGVRFDTQNLCEFWRDNPSEFAKVLEERTLPCGKGVLVVPLRDLTGEIQSLQAISPEGGMKGFLKGGRVEGCFHVIGNLNGDGPILVCEGYATAASIYRAIGHTVVCAFTAGNLEAVTEKIFGAFPNRKIAVCADNDRHLNSKGIIENRGVIDAHKVAEKFSIGLIIPIFRGSVGTDFNDLERHDKPSVIREQIQVGLARDPKPYLAEIGLKLEERRLQNQKTLQRSSGLSL